MPLTFKSKLRDELLNGEIFYSLAEVKVIIEAWRRYYKYRAATLIALIQTTGAGGHCLACATTWIGTAICPDDGGKADHALRLKQDHLMGAVTYRLNSQSSITRNFLLYATLQPATLGDPVDQTFFFEMEDGYQKIVRIESGDTQTSFHVQICDHMAAIQREYDVNVPTGKIASIWKNDMYVVATVRVKGLLRTIKELYV